MRVYIFIGPPASGKGTYGKLIGKLPGFKHLSMGQVFRSRRPRDEEEREELERVSSLTSEGNLAPDELTLRLFQEQIEQSISSGEIRPEEDTVILDGIPRTGFQAKVITEQFQVLKSFFFICDQDTIFRRIKRRSVVEGRADDASIRVVEQRLKIYNSELPGMKDALPSHTHCQIDTDRPSHHVMRDILAVMD